VRPGWQCSDQDENQNDDQYRTHVFLLLLRELLTLPLPFNLQVDFLTSLRANGLPIAKEDQIKGISH
jgi:hypothetical protein